MKNSKKLPSASALFIFAGIMFIIAALISIFAGNKLMSAAYIPIGLCFITIGISKRNDDEDN